MLDAESGMRWGGGRTRLQGCEVGRLELGQGWGWRYVQSGESPELRSVVGLPEGRDQETGKVRQIQLEKTICGHLSRTTRHGPCGLSRCASSLLARRPPRQLQARPESRTQVPSRQGIQVAFNKDVTVTTGAASLLGGR